MRYKSKLLSGSPTWYGDTATAARCRLSSHSPEIYVVYNFSGQLLRLVYVFPPHELLFWWVIFIRKVILEKNCWRLSLLLTLCHPLTDGYFNITHIIRSFIIVLFIWKVFAKYQSLWQRNTQRKKSFYFHFLVPPSGLLGAAAAEMGCVCCSSVFR